MGHKADEKFFEEKREWSKRKDEILGCYLAAYLPKVMRLGKPVLIIDGFAGPGKFADGSKGSPLIICHCITKTLAKNLVSREEVKLVCIEKNDALFGSLEENLSPFSFATARKGSFGDFAEQISEAAKSKTIFLYVDPFTVEGIVWNDLDRIFEGLKTGSSVEILLNLNSGSFIRRGLVALSTKLEEMDTEEGERVDAEIEEAPTIKKLDSVAGGNWWQDLIAERRGFPYTVDEFTKRFCDQMRKRFNEVVYHPVKEKPHHTVPKYSLVFGTRHIDGLVLMNNEMVKSRRELAEMARPKAQLALFETRSEALVPDLDRLPEIILEITKTPMKRRLVVYQVIRNAFCDFTESDIKKCIGTLLKSGKLLSDTGKTRINDDAVIKRASIEP